MAIDLDTIADVAMSSAGAATKILRKGFEGVYKVFSKGEQHDLVTEIDLAVDKAIIEKIHAAFPDHNILSEESGSEIRNLDAPTWVIDPLDGTFNFVHKIPYFATSIGVWHNNEVLFGIVSIPMTNELFWAKKGFGAFVNDMPIYVSQTDVLTDCVLATGIPYYEAGQITPTVEVFSKMLALGCPIRAFGSCAIDLCYLAAGRLDGYWMPKVYPWDMLGAFCIIREAGGMLSLYNGGAYKELLVSAIVASNGKIHKPLIEKIAP